jgi:hypothetical protein
MRESSRVSPVIAARGANWLCLAAAPTSAIMALLAIAVLTKK